MKRTNGLAAMLCIGGFMALAPPAQAADDAGKSASNPAGCKVVQLKPGEQPPSNSSSNPSGTMSSSVTAGGGQVSGHTTGGNSVTMHSGGGNTSSSVTTGNSSGSIGSSVTTGSSGSSSSSSSTTGTAGGGTSTTVTSANGECTVYVNPGK